MIMYALKNKNTGEWYKGGKKPRLYQKNPASYPGNDQWDAGNKCWRPSTKWQLVKFEVIEQLELPL